MAAGTGTVAYGRRGFLRRVGAAVVVLATRPLLGDAAELLAPAERIASRPQTLATYDAILKQYYCEPILEQLNYSSVLLSLPAGTRTTA